MSKKQILICDADGSTRDLIRSVLQEVFESCMIVESPDGLDAYQKVGNQKFNLVVVDTKLPKRDGLQLVQSFNDLPSNQKPEHVLMVSDSVTEASIKSILKNIAYLPKPFTNDQLKKLLNQIFSDKKKSQGGNQVNVDLINPFIDGALTVLKEMTSTEAKKESVFIRKSDAISGDISAIVAINTPKYQGSMAIAFEERCFLMIASRMLGEKYTEITPEISDAAGELCNQIFGIAKRLLNEKGHQIQPALPSVVTGTAHQIRHFVNGPVIAVKFNTDTGVFYIEACVSNQTT